MKAIAFFDFDGTITKSDSFLKFLFFKRRPGVGLIIKIARALPVLAAWKLGIRDNNLSKEKIFSIFFKGVPVNIYNDNATTFASAVLPAMLKKDAMEKINWHIAQQHIVVIVSASVESYISLFAAAIGVEYIATKVETANGFVTGKFASANCYGIEKANRIYAKYSISNYETVYAYGDTKGDKQMLDLADKPFYRYFHS
jgi:phosphatidylglycerophosphatase C